MNGMHIAAAGARGADDEGNFAHIKKWVRTNLLRPSAPFNPPTTPSSQLSGVPPCPASLVAANEGGWLKKKDMVSLLRVPRVEIKLMEIQMPRWMSMPTLRLPSQNRMSSCTIVHPGGELDFLETR